MVDFIVVILIIVVFIIIVGLTIVTIVVIRREQESSNTGDIIDPKRPCTRATDELVNVSQLECCCIGGQQTDFRYIESLDVVVSPGPTYFLDACAGFCKNGNYDPTTERCQSGSSEKFQSCANLTRPVNCDSPAMPVGVDGIEFFYVHSATKEECPTSAACAPAANMCPVRALFE